MGHVQNIFARTKKSKSKWYNDSTQFGFPYWYQVNSVSPVIRIVSYMTLYQLPLSSLMPELCTTARLFAGPRETQENMVQKSSAKKGRQIFHPVQNLLTSIFNSNGVAGHLGNVLLKCCSGKTTPFPNILPLHEVWWLFLCVEVLCLTREHTVALV